MRLDTTVDGSRMCIRMFGELDHHAAKKAMVEIENKIDIYLPRDCVIDMKGLTFMDSSGIAVVLKTYKLINCLGGRTWVENVPQQPLRVLDASGIDRLIKISAIS